MFDINQVKIVKLDVEICDEIMVYRNKSIFNYNPLSRIYPNIQAKLEYILVKYMILKGQMK